MDEYWVEACSVSMWLYGPSVYLFHYLYNKHRFEKDIWVSENIKNIVQIETQKKFITFPYHIVSPYYQLHIDGRIYSDWSEILIAYLEENSVFYELLTPKYNLKEMNYSTVFLNSPSCINKHLSHIIDCNQFPHSFPLRLTITKSDGRPWYFSNIAGLAERNKTKLINKALWKKRPMGTVSIPLIGCLFLILGGMFRFKQPFTDYSGFFGISNKMYKSKTNK